MSFNLYSHMYHNEIDYLSKAERAKPSVSKPNIPFFRPWIRATNNALDVPSSKSALREVTLANWRGQSKDNRCYTVA